MYTTVKLLMLTVFIFIFRRFDNVAFCSPPPFKTNPFDIPVSFRTVSRNYRMLLPIRYLPRPYTMCLLQINTGD